MVVTSWPGTRCLSGRGTHSSRTTCTGHAQPLRRGGCAYAALIRARSISLASCRTATACSRRTLGKWRGTRPESGRAPGTPGTSARARASRRTRVCRRVRISSQCRLRLDSNGPPSVGRSRASILPKTSLAQEAASDADVEISCDCLSIEVGGEQSALAEKADEYVTA